MVISVSLPDSTELDLEIRFCGFVISARNLYVKMADMIIRTLDISSRDFSISIIEIPLDRQATAPAFKISIGVKVTSERAIITNLELGEDFLIA
jgi:hypothetical protein